MRSKYTKAYFIYTLLVTDASFLAVHGPKKKAPRWDFHIPSSLFNRITHSKKKDRAKALKKQAEAAIAASITGE